MKLFRRLFDSEWRERGDASVRARFTQHHDSMAEQVMANRNEVAFLHGELNRLSQDLAHAMILNRALVKTLLGKDRPAPGDMQEALESILAEHRPSKSAQSPSKFCEDCGRPLSEPGQKCPYCSEIEVKVDAAPRSSAPAKRPKRVRLGQVPWTKRKRDLGN
jgi:hypothetical protein